MRSSLSAIAVVAGAFSLHVSASPVQTTRSTHHQPRELLQLPGIWVENIAVRQNGDLLLTTIGKGDIYSFNPSRPNAKPQIVASFDQISAAAGITEIGKDIFAITGAEYSSEIGFTPGSIQMIRADFSKDRCGAHKNTTAPSTDLILRGGDVGPLNGLVTLPWHPNFVLGADSTKGLVWRVDTTSGEAEVIIEDELLTPGPVGPFDFGVNGLKIFGDYLYFTCTKRRALGRVKIDEFGNKVEPAKLIAQFGAADSGAATDDFVMDKKGNAFVTVRPNLLYKVSPAGEMTVVMNGTIVAPASVALSRNEKKLFVVTAGDEAASIGGQVVELDI
ncbi:unnamed protein product [Clonostachys chloroleuca]|uniref:SMP-30/Gluconolactonase/LRE-like region domain-containing protein n=1 Tax=Clonostachys chloroleuca TaxID=1926264 RepID=A0AA35MF07_9HYPO|nr:unnamed protein product [Clonostachys chloroleuca]